MNKKYFAFILIIIILISLKTLFHFRDGQTLAYRNIIDYDNQINLEKGVICHVLMTHQTYSGERSSEMNDRRNIYTSASKYKIGERFFKAQKNGENILISNSSINSASTSDKQFQPSAQKGTFTNKDQFNNWRSIKFGYPNIFYQVEYDKYNSLITETGICNPIERQNNE